MPQLAHKPPKVQNRSLQIAIDRNVFEYITSDVANSADVEEGGKYIGYIVPSRDPLLHRLGLAAETRAVVITDYLPSGPNAVRSAVELQPDGEYQERIFRQIESEDSEIEHLGTWHSHHCNGLRTLSGGDIRGYFRTVNKQAYRPDWLLVSLVTRLPSDPSDTGWIDHYLFVSGEDEYQKITDTVKVINLRTRFGQITGHSVATSEEETGEVDSAIVPAESVKTWHETREGKRILAEDRGLFAKHFKEHVKATRRGTLITLTGRVGQIAISLSYPRDGKTSQARVCLHRDDTNVLEINSELEWRWVAMKAALAAAAELK